MEVRLWKELLDPYDQAVSELITKFQNLRREYFRRNLYCPIESIGGRLKSVNSILEKMQRKGISFETLEDEVEDIAGVRLICQFVEDIETVSDLIYRRTDMQVISRKDYLGNQKKSGYRSLHLIIYYTVQTLNGPKKLQVEIQIRTMAMNFWATTEHSMQYKYKDGIPEHIADRLTRTADIIHKLDTEMSAIRSEIMDAQQSNREQTNIVQDILRNIENLYRTENEREIEKIQQEFYRIYALHNLGELLRFSKQLDILAEGSHAQSLESYESQ
jgi:putative GTP pyrophosphokinase